jgi:hypothetical protein
VSVRPTDVLDRAAALVTGLVVAAIGTAAILWPTHLVRGAPEHINTGPVARLTVSTWWPWELAGAGTLLILIGLVWLTAHVPTRRTPVLRVAGGTDPGVIAVNLSGVATAAAAALEQDPNVQSAKGKALTDRGVATVELTVTAVHPANVAAVISAVDTTCGHLAQATGDATVAARTVLQVARQARSGDTRRKPRNLE